MRCKEILGVGIVVAVLMIAGNSAVATTIYDGTIGDADPVTQGWQLTLSGVASATPDAANDLTHLVVTSAGNGKYQIPNGDAEVMAIVADDVYV